MLFFFAIYFLVMNMLFIPVYVRELSWRTFIFCIVFSGFLLFWIWLRQISAEILNDALRQGDAYRLFI